jgi:hypothetical protein
MFDGTVPPRTEGKFAKPSDEPRFKTHQDLRFHLAFEFIGPADDAEGDRRSNQPVMAILKCLTPIRADHLILK